MPALPAIGTFLGSAGSAIGGFLGTQAGGALASGALMAGATAYGASQQRKAASEALRSAEQAGAQQMGLEREMYEQQRAALEPWRQVGIGALQQLSQLYNIQVPQGTFAQAIQANQPAPQTGPTRRDFSTYLSQNPDLMAEFNKPGVQQMFAGDPAAYAQWHYENFGREEGRQLPGMTANVQTITAAPDQFTGEIQQPAQMEGRIMGMPGDMAMGQQQALPTINAPISTQTAPQPAPEQAAPQQPMGQAPAGSDPRFASFFASPDYQYRLQQGSQNVLANRAAMGGLESGAAMRELQNVGQQEAAAEYGNYFNRLATLAGYGTTAANQQAQAGQNYASAYGMNAQNLANLRGETSYQRALASGRTAGTIAGIGQNIFENMQFGGGGARGGFVAEGPKSNKPNRI